MLKTLCLRRAFLAVAVVVLSTVGCGKSAPEGMPETVPFKVKVVNGDKGVADVQIEFVNPQAIGSIAGTTDSSGIAVMKTTFKNFTAVGAPAGEYRVRCIKDPKADHWKTDDEILNMSIPERAAYYDEYNAKCDELPREVPKICGNYDNTPLTASVPAAGGEATIDVAQYKE